MWCLNTKDTIDRRGKTFRRPIHEILDAEAEGRSNGSLVRHPKLNRRLGSRPGKKDAGKIGQRGKN